MKDNFDPKIYLTRKAPSNTQNDEPSAIKLHFLTGEKELFFSDTGKEIERYEGYEGTF